MKENDSVKETRKEKNASRDTAEVDSVGPTDLFDVGYRKMTVVILSMIQGNSTK